MDLSITIPTINTFNVYELTIGSTYINDIKTKANVYNILDCTYYLFKDKQGLLCLYFEGLTKDLHNQKWFEYITHLPFYTNSQKVECLLLCGVLDDNNLYTTRIFV